MVTGMRDFLPSDKSRREKAISTIRESYSAYGFTEIETPALESIDTLRKSAGGDNNKMTFEVLKRRIKPEAFSTRSSTELVDLGLRYDLTVPLARYFSENRGVLPPVFKAFQIGSVWRAERPQKGRYRQFVQCDMDIIGEKSTLAELELIITAIRTLDKLGLTGYTVKLNDRRLLDSLMSDCSVPEQLRANVLVVLDKRDKLAAEKLNDELQAIGLSTEQATKLNELYSLPEDSDLKLVIESVNRLIGREVAAFEPSLVRGMGYYTGMIYEVTVESESFSVGGGGRYDTMIGSNTPAVGFSIGFERIMGLIDTPKSSRQLTALLYADESPQAFGWYLELKDQLVTAGADVQLIKRSKNTKALLARLATEGFTKFAFVEPFVTPQVRDLTQ